MGSYHYGTRSDIPLAEEQETARLRETLPNRYKPKLMCRLGRHDFVNPDHFDSALGLYNSFSWDLTLADPDDICSRLHLRLTTPKGHLNVPSQICRHCLLVQEKTGVLNEPSMSIDAPWGAPYFDCKCGKGNGRHLAEHWRQVKEMIRAVSLPVAQGRDLPQRGSDNKKKAASAKKRTSDGGRSRRPRRPQQ